VTAPAPHDPTATGAAQSAAFRDADPADWTTDEQLARIAEPYTGPTSDPAAFDPTAVDGWDAGREDPKELDEARQAAVERGDDPAPYDGLGG
jgi:hypothetical protein